MKLISMIDFVFEQLIVKQSTSEFKEVIKNYANFLKKPLTREMFDSSNEKHLFKEFIFIMEWFRIEHKPNSRERNTRKLNEVFDKSLTIEDIVGVFHNVELTDSAIKQIGL